MEERNRGGRLWAVSLGEDGDMGVHGDAKGVKSGRLDWSWKFSWDKCGVSDTEGREFSEVTSWWVQ